MIVKESVFTFHMNHNIHALFSINLIDIINLKKHFIIQNIRRGTDDYICIIQEKKSLLTDEKSKLHRPGIEPGPPVWQASILPLNHRCLYKCNIVYY